MLHTCAIIFQQEVPNCWEIFLIAYTAQALLNHILIQMVVYVIHICKGCPNCWENEYKPDITNVTQFNSDTLHKKLS